MTQIYNIRLINQIIFDYNYSNSSIILIFVDIKVLFSTINSLIMVSFGKKLRECREGKSLSQNEVAKLLNTNHSIIGKYERDEVKPTIDVVKKLADVLDTTVGFLLGESNQLNILKDSAMLDRLNDLQNLSDKDKDYILYILDGLIRDAKARKAYAI